MERISLQKFKALTPEEIGKMNKAEVINLLGDAREKLQKRLTTFSKQGKNFYSPAQEKLAEYYDDNRPVPLDEISRNRALNELFSIQSFFQAKTGSVAGAREVMREQDINIFGINPKTGFAPHRMTKTQRTAFWEVYHEFLNDKKNAIEMFTSDKIIQYLGERVVAAEGRVLDYRNDASLFTQIYNDLQKRKNLAEAQDNVLPNVFTGRRNN